MGDFPAANSFLDTNKNAGEAQVLLEEFLAASKQLPGGQSQTTLQISGGSITVTGAMHRVQAESGGVDSLTDIVGAAHPDARWVVLRPLGTDVITVVHDAAKIDLHFNVDYVMNNADMGIMLAKSGGGNLFQEIQRFGRESIHIVGDPTEPPFLNSWTGFTFAVRFFKSPTGLVVLEGFARNLDPEGNGLDIFSLPAGYFPGTYLHSYKVRDTGSGSQERTQRITVNNSTGAVAVSRIDGTSGDEMRLEFSGIQFPTEL